MRLPWRRKEEPELEQREDEAPDPDLDSAKEEMRSHLRRAVALGIEADNLLRRY